ncbi:MAG: hypothetical protein UX08_C0001G0029 [Candidatus Collierbacteria bacterium GW2011_GWB1_45_35]|uniref:Uncharacterized protein n=2 Tax=Candidatus Collieribacteriota TaxID=1752725 RepID=A0A0G1KSF1_9BACT|nr:MAG: hypothetical protein UW48_C0003G0026 [Microgenomates group bacterium GW2011_GWC1_44_23]KKT86435.1 MAG: hypothetical protein UW84_C0011G0002 [Candidatus Collierbacteria bacterium GW2011_GWA2_44_99]KKT95891.1 MAG: hypothetical protein UW96_C0003G0026 [Candidatus Collierbacteria bacterium GW2011_GWA1_45_15]KKU01005.1 MAG: hypothetical protein UX01_C0003G0058 [Candidatus Collierbacteria bacterium GW2011_GWB2_45_17]KKU05902.1 MAG: hypothetical protein UX08_C0001G0029 [Candidatus Collierbacte
MSEKYEWQELPSIVYGNGNDEPVREGEIELNHCPHAGDYIEVGDGDQLRVSKVVHRTGKPVLLVC